MYVHFGGRNVSCGFSWDGEKLSLGLLGEVTIAEVYNAFSPENMHEISIYNDDNTVNSIFSNQRVIGIYWSSDHVQIDCQVDPLQVTEATRIREEAEVSDGAIAELAEMIADLEARVEALEGGNE